MMRRDFKGLIFLLIIIMLFTLTACQGAGDKDDKFTVAVSIIPQATFVKAVGGDLVDVVTMIPPGSSPANYAPSPKELTRFSDSSIYFSLGVPADMANILPKAKEFNPEMKVVKLFEEVAKVYKDREFAPGQRDPHIWLSPKRVKVMVKVITRELAEIDKENKAIYEKNANEYLNKLDKLDKEIRESLANLENRTFIVYHPAFGYFADDYGLKMLAIEKDGKEATPKRLQEIINIAKEKNIKAVFYQAEIDSKQSKAIAEEIGGKTVQVDPLASNYIENLQKTAEVFKSILD